jgi:ATP-dependent helicase/DNAse subunit B
MPVQLILAPPAAGKTQTCIQRLQSIRQSAPLAPIWVLVPDAQNAAYFRQRLALSGGGVGVNVGTFRALYMDILERSGHYKPVITPALEHRLTQQTVDAAFAAGELAHYAAIKNKPGFIAALQDIFSELRSAYIHPERFLTYTRDARPAKSELAHLYASFVGQLKKINWIDRDGQIWGAITALEDDHQAAAHISLLVVDGFSAFAGARLQFLKKLSKQVGEMLITLPGLQDSTRPVHRRSQQVINTLMSELSPQVTQLSSPPKLPSESLYLEQHVLDPGEYPKIPAASPIFIEAQSQGEEAREALRWVKALNKREAIPLSACAIFAADLTTYRPLLKAAANEFGIKLYFSQSESLLNSPAIHSLLNLLELPNEDYQIRALFNSLHTPYFDFSLDFQAIKDLEAVSQHAHVVFGREQWQEAWNRILQAKTTTDNELDDESHYKNPLAGIDLPALKDSFSHFWKIFENIEEIRSLEEWITWLDDTLENLRFYDHISGERDQEACKSLEEALKALILSENIAGIRKINYQRFISDLQNTLQGARLDEPRASRKNMLLVGKISEARASRFDAVVLMGFSEGVFPNVENPDPFLDETLRHDLGLDPRLGREQSSTFYEAFTRANKCLMLTRPSLSEDGESWEPSPYWESAVSLFSKNVLTKFSQSTTRNQSNAASPQELLFWAVQQNHLKYQNDDDLFKQWKYIQSSRKVLNARRSKLAFGPFEGYTDQIAGALAEKYSNTNPWSASSFETYGSCPYQYFVQKVLNLEAKDPPELGLNYAQEGSIMHRILERVYKQADKDADVEQVLKLLEIIATEVFEQAPVEFGFRPSALWVVEQTQMVRVMRETIQALEINRGDWVPFAFEAKFGIDGLPNLFFDVGTEKIRLRGMIDRVDKNEDGEIRVIDYKRSDSSLSEKDFIKGHRLQLPIYALAAQDALGLGPVKEGFYWVVKDAKMSSLRLSKFESDEEDGLTASYKILQEHLKNYLANVRAGYFPPKPPDNNCPDYCPATQWCWRYQPRNF